MIWGSGGSKSNLPKAAGAEPAGQMRDEKLHAVVARSTFPSQKCKTLRVSDHFLTVRCRKSARRCGAKTQFQVKSVKSSGFGPLLDVQMSKKWALTNLTNLTDLASLSKLTNKQTNERYERTN